MKKAELLELLSMIESQLKGYKITLKSEAPRSVSLYFADGLDPNAGASLLWCGDSLNVDKYLINPYKAKNLAYIANLTPTKETIVREWVESLINDKRA